MIIGIIIALAGILILNRPRLATIDAAIPEDFPTDGFSHQVIGQLLQDDVDYDCAVNKQK